MSKCESCGKESDRLAPLSSGQMICAECRDQIADAAFPDWMPSWAEIRGSLFRLVIGFLMLAAVGAFMSDSPLKVVHALLSLIAAILFAIWGEMIKRFEK